MKRTTMTLSFAALAIAAFLVLGTEQTTLAGDGDGQGWTPVPTIFDPLIRMPGTQPTDGVTIEPSSICLACHSNYDPAVEPGHNWRGTMMGNSARDFIFWAALTVAGQDSIHFIDRPNAMDLCLRCHMPEGWLGGRSTQVNGSIMTGHDFDGVSCDFCHRMYDPFHVETIEGMRPQESNDWAGYWDEAPSSQTLMQDPSAAAAWITYLDDRLRASRLKKFNGTPLFGKDGLPFSEEYRESGGGQYYVSTEPQKRASFADPKPNHKTLYSRYHKSKYFCSTCHDVSNPVVENLAFEGTEPGDGVTILPSEEKSAASFSHVERTFSEFMLSDYGLDGGAPGIGPYDPSVFATSRPNNNIATCQDCHMPDAQGKGCRFDVPVRPDDSRLHPKSGQPVHDLTGGNMWVPWVLASTVAGSPNYDATNDMILNAGPSILTLDLSAGLGLDADALLDAVDRTQQTLQRAASIEDLDYDPSTGATSFRVQNQTGHKLITGYAEGRRMFLNVRAYAADTLIYEINPYDDIAATLRGLPLDYSPNSPPLGPNEEYDDDLVYEVHHTSSITGEEVTFHFALATGRSKDNRIPPKGFRINEAADRLCEPVIDGAVDPKHFTSAEYAGGYEGIDLMLPAGADRVEVALYYQTISREYVEFLESEIKGTGTTLPPTAYVIQTDPFFSQLKEWGRAIRRIWDRNKDVPGAAPVEMTSAVFMP